MHARRPAIGSGGARSTEIRAARKIRFATKARRFRAAPFRTNVTWLENHLIRARLKKTSRHTGDVTPTIATS
jgi:hypothetical protein